MSIPVFSDLIAGPRMVLRILQRQLKQNSVNQTSRNQGVEDLVLRRSQMPTPS